jgi:hypothetical protein
MSDDKLVSSDLIDDIYAAALGEQGWDTFLQKLRGTDETRLVNLLSFDNSSQLPSLITIRESLVPHSSVSSFFACSRIFAASPTLGMIGLSKAASLSRMSAWQWDRAPLVPLIALVIKKHASGEEEMKSAFRSGYLKLSLSASLAVLLAACGSSSNPASTAAGTGSTGSTGNSTISGTAATGSALANANVSVTDSAGNSPCVETGITTSALGVYTCTLKSRETAPFVVVVTDPTGNTQPLVSVTTTTPAAGTPLTLNATPLTTAIVTQLTGGNPLSIVGKAVDATALQTITNNVVAQLAPVLSAIGLTSYDPFSTAITAASTTTQGSTSDQLLDIVKVTTSGSGALQLSTVDGTPVPLASATGAGATLAAPAANVQSLPQAMQQLAGALTRCFALSAEQRGTAGTDTSATAVNPIPTVNSMASACSGLFDAGYKHNGYTAGEKFYGMLVDSGMTGVKFPVPEITAFYAADANNPDRAVINIKYVNSNGYPGNIFSVMRFISGNWVHTGNQQMVDVDVKPMIRRVQQLNAGNTAATKQSGYQSGIQFAIDALGPNSIDASGNKLGYAIATGPGLPTNGIVYIAPSSSLAPGQTYMDISNTGGYLTSITSALASGSSTDSLRCGNGTPSPSTNPTNLTANCPNFWFYKTAGISGSAATTTITTPTPKTNSNYAGPSGTNTNWAQPGDGSNAAQVTQGRLYTVTLYYVTSSGATSSTLTVTKTALSDEVQATQAVNLPWNSAGNQTQSLFASTSLAAAQTSITLDWVLNPAAEPYKSAAVTIDTVGTYGNSIAIPKGSASLTLPNTGMPAVTVNQIRAVLFNYQLLDNSNKSDVYTYN